MQLTGYRGLIRIACAGGLATALIAGIAFGRPDAAVAERVVAAVETAAPIVEQTLASVPPPPPVAVPPPVAEVMQSGVLIVISKASQQMYVFQDGVPWQSSPVSTGRRGHSTPSGVFPILQKAVRHRSNIYSNAPMPYMQRLTWGGIAIHAGRLPGYPASHGCIRVPYGFARALYGLTRMQATTVVVTSAPVRSHADAGQLALSLPDARVPVPGAVAPPTRWASARVTAPPPARQVAAAPQPVAPVPQPAPVMRGPAQTIQLAAAASPAEAEAHWATLTARHPELSGFQKTVVPAVVGARRVYRLRATAPGAYALCQALKRAGQDCFNAG